MWLCLKIGSENVVVVKMPQKGAQDLTVNYEREKIITIYHNINGAAYFICGNSIIYDFTIVSVHPSVSDDHLIIRCLRIKNKPAVQASGADPSQCNSTNRQNPPLQ